MGTESNVVGNIVLLVFSLSSGGAWLCCFRRCGNTLAEAAAYALLTTLMLEAWAAQALLMAGWPVLYLPVLSMGALLSATYVAVHRRALFAQFGFLIDFVRSHRVAAAGLLLVWGYVAAVGFWPPVALTGSALDYYQPIWNNSHSVFNIWETTPEMVLPVLNHVLFAADWQPSLSICLANLGAFTAIGFSTYALARRYAWPPMAITVVLLVVSMHRVVQQSMAVTSELLPAAAALVAILALYRLCEQPHERDLCVLICSIGFTISGGRLCYLMALVLSGLSLVALSRRHGFSGLGRDLRHRFMGIVVIAAALTVFSQGTIVCANLVAGKPWIGEPVHEAVFFNSDAMSGATANLARYFFLSLELPEFVDQFVRWGFGFSPLNGLKGVYHLLVDAPLAGKGAMATFDWNWAPGSEFAWFGPAGFFLVIPSVGMALLRGPRRLKSAAMGMTCYWVLIALILAWRPENVRWMTNFFVCSGFFIAFLLPPWRIGRPGRLLLQTLSILLLVHALLPG